MEFIKEIPSNEKLILSKDTELDIHLDTRGVILKRPVYCAYCMTMMKKIRQEKYKCPICHVIFNDNAA